MPEVSVVMSVYNGGGFLAESIDSVLAQTFADFEFLIVDDGSTDGSAAVLDEYAARDTRIKLIRNKTNIGLTRSLNRAIAEAKGRIIARHDADDIALPGKFAAQVAAFTQYPECDVVGTDYSRIDTEGRSVDEHFQSHVSGDVRGSLIRGRNPLCHASVMYRRSVIEAYGGYDESFRYAQDYELWLRLLTRHRQFLNVPEKLLKVRRFDARTAIAVGSPATHARMRGPQLRCIIRIQLKYLGHFWYRPAYVGYLVLQVARLFLPTRSRR